MQRKSFSPRMFRFGRILVGHGKDMIAFLIATAYSVFTVLAPESLQRHFLLLIHVDPNQRLAVWGFGLAAFFLYAGFRAWGDAEGKGKSDDVENIRSELAQIRQVIGRRITREQRRAFTRASNAMDLKQRMITVAYSPYIAEAQDYCHELILLIRGTRVWSAGIWQTNAWENYDDLGLAIIVPNPEQPPPDSRKLFNLLKEADIQCAWARDNRPNILSDLDIFSLYVGKNPATED
jgi:hypothetical protein